MEKNFNALDIIINTPTEELILKFKDETVGNLLSMKNYLIMCYELAKSTKDSLLEKEEDIENKEEYEVTLKNLYAYMLKIESTFNIVNGILEEKQNPTVLTNN